MKTKFKSLLFLICSLSFLGYSQNDKIELKGIILDESNNPVPFVSVGIIKKILALLVQRMVNFVHLNNVSIIATK